ncbi:MAG: SUMF1/EgtB/PvdO family nonheme iron enzyme [Desulfomonile tiedjei]|nr:SUMF1/EgtB/PvdO family nonheme iron enzyme [Desulfomonile tiedjei]
MQRKRMLRSLETAWQRLSFCDARPFAKLVLRKSIVGTCCIVILVFVVAPHIAARQGDGAVTSRGDTTAKPSSLFSGAVERPMPTDGGCGCRLDALKLLAAAGETGEARAPESERVSLAERVRRAGDLLAKGDNTRAKEIIHNAVRECETGEGDTRDCSQWMPALKGLDSVVQKAKERIVVTNSVGMRLVRIPASEYMMGSPKQEMDWLRLKFKKVWRPGHKQWFEDELPLHPVRITKPFYLSATETTVAQFREFVKETGHKTDAEKGDGGMIWSDKEQRWAPQKENKWDVVPWKIADNQPVVFVSWNDADAFCRWLSRKEKRKYRLPTEAEWEMACRGGSVWVRYPWGDRLPGDRDSNFAVGNPKLPESLTTVNHGYRHVAPVGSFPSNGFGLHDMSGNVMEWVQDSYDRNYFQESPLEDPQGPSGGTSRVNKGGNFFASPQDDRCAFRGFSGPTMSFWNLGFRVVMEEKDAVTETVAGKSGASEEKTPIPAGNADLPPTEDQGIRLFRQAVYAAQQEQWDNAIQDLEEALKLYEKREDYQWIARVKATLAGIYAERNRTYKSKELYTQALAEFRKIGDTASARLLLARLRELETSPGVRVVEVQKGGLASKAGIVTGDVIIEYGGETGFRVTGFKKLIDEYRHAEQVTLSVVNNDEISTVVVPGGMLGVAVEDIKRPPRPRRPPERERPRDQQRQQRARPARDRR